MKRRIWIESVKKTLYGIGAIEEVGQRLKELGINKVLLVMDKELGKTSLRERLEGILEESEVEFLKYLEITSEPSPELADKGAFLAKEGKVLGVLGVGGGSALDVAKAISVLVTNPGGAKDYIGLNLVKFPGIPTILVPTTAGTGSEATFTAVFTMREERKKGGINSPFLYPQLAILDPELTLSLPPRITAYTGMDALTHAIESYTSRSSHFMSKPISLEAIDLIWNSIRDAVYNGEDIHPRAKMMKGSYLAGLGLAMAGVGAVHAMAYPLGAFFEIPHGLANAVMLPYVLSYNLPGAIKGYGEISYIMGSTTEDYKEAASELPSTIFELLEDIGLPTSLKELNVPKDAIPDMADMALTVSRPMANNPKPLSREELIDIYETAYGE